MTKTIIDTLTNAMYLIIAITTNTSTKVFECDDQCANQFKQRNGHHDNLHNDHN